MSMLDGVANYYEHLVVEALEKEPKAAGLTGDVLEDIVCVALNHLPPRYYRHSVDLIFYMSDVEEAEMRSRVTQAVGDAVEFVRNHQRGDGNGDT